ncbi:MAG TPA: winged helix DNA-binding domain-containing protein [Cyclobacteriaceae bacterium]|nr:winged helix DNA-binding domain-containing protein [Cyclobacteriaceae bacterium]
MTLSEIAYLRLANQQLMEASFTSPKEVVGWMGAMQAQDYYMAKWAIGSRMRNATDKAIEESINRCEIVRTHVMRPTWHFVLAEDVRWMLELTAPHIKAAMKTYQTKLQLNEKIFYKTNDIIARLLEGGNYLTRTEIVAELRQRKIKADNLQATHIMFDAELNGIVCNGPMRGKQFTYSLIDERIPKTKSITKEEALYNLSKKYFTGHGPATIQDFMWWSGLPAADAKMGLDLAKEKLVSEKIDNKIYWHDKSLRSTQISKQTTPLFLPAYDEFMIGYTDRSASLHPKFAKIILVGNGIFRPIIVSDGKAIGIWLRTIKKNHVSVTTKFFSAKDKMKKSEISLLLQPFEKFLSLDLKI